MEPDLRRRRKPESGNKVKVLVLCNYKRWKPKFPPLPKGKPVTTRWAANVTKRRAENPV
jgi:hypothetical protein